MRGCKETGKSENTCPSNPGAGWERSYGGPLQRCFSILLFWRRDASKPELRNEGHPGDLQGLPVLAWDGEAELPGIFIPLIKWQVQSRLKA